MANQNVNSNQNNQQNQNRPAQPGQSGQRDQQKSGTQDFNKSAPSTSTDRDEMRDRDNA